MQFAFDIETTKNDYAKDFFMSGLAKPNWRLKDPEKIKADLDKQFYKSGLCWWTGKVCCITAKSVDGSVSFLQVHEDEKKLLTNFAEFIVFATQKFGATNFIGKSSKGFDFPFLVGRYMANDIGVPKTFMMKRQIVDVDEIFSQYGKNGQVTNLQNYAWGLNIAGKTVSNGAEMIGEWLEAKQYEILLEYCDQDTSIVLEMLKRYRPYEKV
jgi:predicted PolB exonuclease-like 3'-5' exonuclease